MGYVVEKVAGISYENYMKNNILNPLHMDSSSVRMDDKNMAKGYEYTEEKYIEDPFAYQYTSGSSGIISTASDMAHFMLMNLNNGSYQGVQVIDTNCINQMHSKEFSNNEVFEGMGYGFVRTKINGVQILKHEGALPGYTTTLMLLPEENVGVYVSTNSLNGFIFDFEEAFINYFYPNNDAGMVQDGIENARVYNRAKYTGIYRTYDGISETSIMKLGILFDPTVDLVIGKAKDDRLILREYSESKVLSNTFLNHKEGNVFSREDMKGYFTFRQNDKGKVIYAFNDISYKTYDKISIFESRQFFIAFFCLIFLIWIISIVFLIIRLIKRKTDGNRFLHQGIIACDMFFMIGFIGCIISTFYVVYSYDNSSIWMITLFISMILLGSILHLCCIIDYIGSIIKKKLSPKKIWAFAKVIILNTIYVGLMQYFNLLGYHIY